MSKKISAGRIRLKRAYEPPSGEDGPRILIDRLWPRGVKKKEAQVDQWAKDIAPSTETRKWLDTSRGAGKGSVVDTRPNSASISNNSKICANLRARMRSPLSMLRMTDPVTTQSSSGMFC